MGCINMMKMFSGTKYSSERTLADFDDIFYSSGESDVEFIAPFNDLSTDEK